MEWSIEQEIVREHVVPIHKSMESWQISSRWRRTCGADDVRDGEVGVRLPQMDLRLL